MVQTWLSPGASGNAHRAWNSISSATIGFENSASPFDVQAPRFPFLALRVAVAHVGVLAFAEAAS